MAASPEPTGEAVRPHEVLQSVLADRVPLDGVRDLAGDCRACGLWANATGTVFGERPTPARWMLIGEQPGDREDLKQI